MAWCPVFPYVCCFLFVLFENCYLPIVYLCHEFHHLPWLKIRMFRNNRFYVLHIYTYIYIFSLIDLLMLCCLKAAEARNDTPGLGKEKNESPRQRAPTDSRSSAAGDGCDGPRWMNGFQHSSHRAQHSTRRWYLLYGKIACCL